MLSEEEFLAPNGIRSLSKFHKENPVEMDVNGQKYKVEYLPGDSDSGLFGGNSNWRGPIWMAPNFLLVESLLRCYMFYGNTFKVECPTGSGDVMHLGHVAEEVQHRLTHLMAKGDDGRRAINDGNDMLDFDEHWKDTPHFYEFFDGDTGRGLGASHQCGWTGLIAKMIHDTGLNCRLPQTPRSPAAAASHYFDDTFTRQRRQSMSGTRRNSLARSMTRTRSIGAGSDWETAGAGTPGAPSTAGGDDDDDDADNEAPAGEIYKEDPTVSSAGMGESSDDHITKYVQEQLQRLKTNESAEFSEEIAASGDAAADKRDF